MTLDSSNAKHKLFIAGLLLALFAIPFAWQWSSLTKLDSRPLMAGGATLANTAQNNQPSDTPVTNHTAQAGTSAGSSFTGVLTR